LRLRNAFPKQVLAAILLLAAGAGGAASAARRAGETRAIVTLPENASVVGPRITLGEVARLKGRDNALVVRLERLEIANAAPAGHVLKLTAASVRIALRKSGIRQGDVEVTGATETAVSTQSQEFDPSTLEGTVRDLVTAATGESRGDVEVQLPSPQKVRVPAGTLTTRVKPPVSGRYEGSQLYTIEIIVDGRLVKRQPLRAQVSIRRNAVVTLERIERGAKLEERNVALQRVPAAQAGGDALTDLSVATGRTAGRMLEPGRVVRLADLSDPPLVRRSANVTAVVRKNNIEVAVDAKALEDGKAGQVIKIQNASSGKIFRARVLDEKNVEVVEPPKRK
jgi:flagella basal body P-ring formation protein FlgA